MKPYLGLVLLIALVVVSAVPPVLARGGHSGSHPTGGHKSTGHLRSDSHPKSYCTACARDKNGRIKRNSAERRKFLKSQGLTHTPPGNQVDHIVPLAKGGEDKATNMQLIPKDSEKEKNELK